MKNTLLLLFFFFALCADGFTQSNWSRQDRQDFRSARVALVQGDYAYVYNLLEPLHAKDTSFAPLNLALGIATLEWKNNKERALDLLGSAAVAGLHTARYHYARALHRSMRFSEAIDWYMYYLESGDDTIDQQEVLREIAISQRAQEAIAHPVDVRIANLGPNVNSEHNEYVPVITPDNKRLYFTSRRPDSTGGLTDPDGAYFEDIYRTDRTEEGWSQAVNVGQPINTDTHDATVSISADGRTMIIYRTNENLTGGDLYITHRRDGKWSTPEKLPPTINSPHQEASATLSPDKNTLIFSSNRPGGYGGKDLYRVRRLPNGDWSLPRNLGPIINTPYDEDAPHLDVDGRTLYFASNGHTTIGGYDIFKSTHSGGETWSVPENLGYPINTVDDDLYLSLDAGGRTGYFSSARQGGFGQQDLYSVDFVYRRSVTIVLRGEVLDEEGSPIQASLTIIDESTREVQGIYRTNRNTGRFIAVLHPVTQYKVLIEASGYDSVIDELIFPFPEEADDNNIEFTPYILRQQ